MGLNLYKKMYFFLLFCFVSKADPDICGPLETAKLFNNGLKVTSSTCKNEDILLHFKVDPIVDETIFYSNPVEFSFQLINLHFFRKNVTTLKVEEPTVFTSYCDEEMENKNLFAFFELPEINGNLDMTISISNEKGGYVTNGQFLFPSILKIDAILELEEELEEKTLLFWPLLIINDNSVWDTFKYHISATNDTWETGNFELRMTEYNKIFVSPFMNEDTLNSKKSSYIEWSFEIQFYLLCEGNYDTCIDDWVWICNKKDSEKIASNCTNSNIYDIPQIDSKENVLFVTRFIFLATAVAVSLVFCILLIIKIFQKISVSLPRCLYGTFKSESNHYNEMTSLPY